MTGEIDLLSGLLSSALTGKSMEIPAGSDWQRLFRLLQQNHVAALASEALGHLPQEQKPPRNVLIPWLSEREKATAWYHHQLVGCAQTEIAPAARWRATISE